MVYKYLSDLTMYMIYQGAYTVHNIYLWWFNMHAICLLIVTGWGREKSGLTYIKLFLSREFKKQSEKQPDRRTNEKIERKTDNRKRPGFKIKSQNLFLGQNFKYWKHKIINICLKLPPNHFIDTKFQLSLHLWQIKNLWVNYTSV